MNIMVQEHGAGFRKERNYVCRNERDFRDLYGDDYIAVKEKRVITNASTFRNLRIKLNRMGIDPDSVLCGTINAIVSPFSIMRAPPLLMEK